MTQIDKYRDWINRLSSELTDYDSAEKIPLEIFSGIIHETYGIYLTGTVTNEVYKISVSTEDMNESYQNKSFYIKIGFFTDHKYKDNDVPKYCIQKLYLTFDYPNIVNDAKFYSIVSDIAILKFRERI